MFSGDLFSVLDESTSSKEEKNAEKLTENVKRPSIEVSEEKESKKLKIDYGLNIKSLEADVPATDIHKIFTSDSCLHEVAVPKGITYTPISTEPLPQPAKEYSFTLDPFQKQALLCLENKQSVLVSAHTSAGKTVIAEYAVALSLKARQRVIYTTPIKALSNQKYRELLAEFVDVGLMTGDVTINPTASCLVMTTEILRSMLYRGSEVMREAAWVVFDEIHYMRDKERGVVWEESIILLPDNIHYIFLSATIPNARQFAEWISHVHKQPCHVVYTEYRPTPLQHYIYPAGGDGIHLVVDENRNFREDNFNKAMKLLATPAEGSRRGWKGSPKGKSNCFSVVKMAMERNLTPIIIFSFSKKECEALALQLCRLDFNGEKEKSLVELVFTNAIDTLSDEDKKLPQLGTMLPLLCRGIGIHHSGLLPLLKEVVEILFSEGLIKVLCATETFAMGMNMPARTVLFSSARKFDGKEFRWITSGEYIQMSGRAGRRGLDDRGIVILMLYDSLTPSDCKLILQGQPALLNSAFQLTYTMIVNMLRVEGIEPEFMLHKSFLQFQNSCNLPALLQDLKEKEKEAEGVVVTEETETYCKLKQQVDSVTKQIASYMHQPHYILPFLQPGRLLRIVSEGTDFGWGVVVNIRKKADQSDKSHWSNPASAYILDTLLHLSPSSSSAKHVDQIAPCPPNQEGSFQVVPVSLAVVTLVSVVCLYVPKSLIGEEARKSVLACLKAVKTRFHDHIPLLDPFEHMNIDEPEFITLSKKLKDLNGRLENHPLHNSPSINTMIHSFKSRQKFLGEVKEVKKELRGKRNSPLNDQLTRMKRLLRRLAYTSSSDVVQIKGMVACEITTADVLVLCELLFNGTFNKLSPSDVCSLLSCLAFQEKGSTNSKMSESLTNAYKQLKEAAQNVGRVSSEVGLKLPGGRGGVGDGSVDEYVDSFQAHMMPVVQAWCEGKPFVDVCKMTTIYEGSIIRCIRRLEECLRQLWQAAKVMGNQTLEQKFQEGIKVIKRDIVFANSLYL